MLILPALLAGCQAYRPAPLDLDAHLSAAATRDPASADVAAFARSLSAAGDARPFDPSDGFSLAEARIVALYFNPELRAARLKAGVPAAAAKEAGRIADPVLRIDAERITQSVADRWVAGGMLEFTIPLWGTPALEKAHAVAVADVALVEAIDREGHLLDEVTVAWINLHQVDRKIAVTQAFVADLQTFVRQGEALQRAGELGPLEVGLLRLELGRRQAELRSLAHRRTEAELAVKSLMGLLAEAQVRLNLSLPQGDFPPDLAADRRRQMLAHHPDVLAAKRQYEVAERSLELEIRRQYPDLTIGGGFGTEDGTERILGGLGIPIPLFNANRQAIAEATAQRNATRAAAEAMVESLTASLARAEASWSAARSRREALEQDVAPLIDAQLKSARELGKAGNLQPITVFETLVRAHDARLEILEAAGDEATALSTMERLLGGMSHSTENP